MFQLYHEKMRSPAGTTFKNPKISLRIGNNLEVQPQKIQKINKKYSATLKNPNFACVDELGKIIC